MKLSKKRKAYSEADRSLAKEKRSKRETMQMGYYISSKKYLFYKYKKSPLLFMDTITDAIDKRFSKSLITFLKLVDPERKYRIDELLGKTWDRLSLNEQRKLYLYILYRKWRGLDVYGEPYYVIMNCHPVPFNWNGTARCEELIKEGKVLIAKYNGSWGFYTKDEITLYGLEIKTI